MTAQIAPPGLAEATADRLRDQIIDGVLRPGQRLSETRLAADLMVSRNTLREAFRLLTREGLLTHLPHRGVSVAVPSMASILDIYRVRRLIEVPALAQAWPRHPAVAQMTKAVAAAEAFAAGQQWRAVGSANIDFHTAVVALADSPRLSAFFRHLVAELRLAFGLLDSPERLHAPLVAANRDILSALRRDDAALAAERLAAYLDQSERVVMTAFARIAQADKQGQATTDRVPTPPPPPAGPGT